MTQTNGELITAMGVSMLLGMSVSTVRRKAESGELEHVGKLPPPNGAFLFRRDYIERLASDAAEAAPQAS